MVTLVAIALCRRAPDRIGGLAGEGRYESTLSGLWGRFRPGPSLAPTLLTTTSGRQHILFRLITI